MKIVFNSEQFPHIISECRVLNDCECECDKCKQSLYSCLYITWCDTCKFKNCNNCHNICTEHQCTNCCENNENNMKCTNCQSNVCQPCINRCEVCEIVLNCARCHSREYDGRFQYCDSKCSEMYSSIKTTVDTIIKETFNYFDPNDNNDPYMLNFIYFICLRCSLNNRQNL